VEERERLGGPPTPEDLVAYARGELSESEAARIRRLLVAYPEFADVLVQTEPEPGAKVLTPDELAHDWAALKQRIAAEWIVQQQPPIRVPAPVLAAVPKPPIVSRVMPVAAALCITVLAAWLVESRLTIERLTREREAPRVHAVRHELTPIPRDRGRGAPEPYPLPVGEENYLLVPLLYEHVPGAAYRLDVVDVRSTPPRIVWSSRIPQRRDETLEVSVPRAFFHAGITYRLDLYRVDTPGLTPAASYLVRAEPR